MRALVVHESMSGTTGTVASAVAEGLSAYLDVTAVAVDAAPAVIGPDVDLLVVGGPTHAFPLGRPDIQRSAAEPASGFPVPGRLGLARWLERTELPGSGVRAAAFDTRLAHPTDQVPLPGSATNGVAGWLRQHGLRLVVPPVSFLVADQQGPPLAGEVERARQWADGVGSVARGLVSATLPRS